MNDFLLDFKLEADARGLPLHIEAIPPCRPHDLVRVGLSLAHTLVDLYPIDAYPDGRARQADELVKQACKAFWNKDALLLADLATALKAIRAEQVQDHYLLASVVQACEAVCDLEYGRRGPLLPDAAHVALVCDPTCIEDFELVAGEIVRMGYEILSDSGSGGGRLRPHRAAKYQRRRLIRGAHRRCCALWCAVGASFRKCTAPAWP